MVPCVKRILRDCLREASGGIVSPPIEGRRSLRGLCAVRARGKSSSCLALCLHGGQCDSGVDECVKIA